MAREVKPDAFGTPKPIDEIAASAGLLAEELEHYGRYKAKITDAAARRLAKKPDGRLILVTATNPTPSGEGKTTVTIGLGQALARLGKRTVIALREPSLGPVFGTKGGATGGGGSQLQPMQDINLHFTGDLHAVTAANNLLCAAVDNHLYHGNRLRIDPERICVRRALDVNDRALRKATIGQGERRSVERAEQFTITAASEVMAILCLAQDLQDFQKRCGDILVAYDLDGGPVYARDLKAEGAMAALAKDAILPNLVQTTEHTPCLIHGGPFANIAHGCNSVRATRLALKLGDYVVTEAGFGADLGAEKFIDIKCRQSGLRPSVAVLVTTVRSLKYNGGAKPGELDREDIFALGLGANNLERHVRNLLKFNLPVVVALNRFKTDTEEELGFLRGYCESIGAVMRMVDCYDRGGEGATELAKQVLEIADLDQNRERFGPLYPVGLPIKDKLHLIATEIYGAARIEYTEQAEQAIRRIEALGRDGLPVCVAKTQFSFSDDPKKLGSPAHFTITVRDVALSNGAGFIVAMAGDITTMPGLPAAPALEKINVDKDGTITGIF
ncbi:MAG: formate--tetrahydrofolate ligase [Clostridiales bacterium]|nr:formate--tetrahydrofolate ligase [Clostridiales bacterium]